MHPFHFGSSQKRLFGVYHAPETSRLLAGVVICQPFGHEYIRVHRALRNLAGRLAAMGLHVLRFDYFGCGDSAGEGEDGGPVQWQMDVGTAIDELKDMAGLARVSVIGVRFGATVTALASAERKDVDLLLLWDPVLRGDDYITELRSVQSEWLKTRPRLKEPRGRLETAELIGFPVTERVRKEFHDVDLLVLKRWTARRLMTLLSHDVEADGLRAHLSRMNVPCTFEHVRCKCDWRRPEAVHLALLANEMVQEIARCFESGVRT